MKFRQKAQPIIEKNEIEQLMLKLRDYQNQLKEIVDNGGYLAPESSINLPSDTDLLSEVNELTSILKNNNLKYIFVVGIGGSNLGTKAVYDSLFGFYDILEQNRFPKIVFFDTQEASFLGKLPRLVSTINSSDEFVINAISKSGGTTETMANLEVLSSILSEKFPDLKNRIVFTTDGGSKMHEKAKEMGIKSLTMPKIVGGRFSIFSSVGLFPLALCDINIDKLRAGAVKIRELCVNYQGPDNPALVSATTLYLASQKGININDNFIFAPQLESLGKWYRQLMGESIGKDGKGITPTVSIGSTDLHSMGQLYLGGPKDKITSFISVEKNSDIKIPENIKYEMVDQIRGRSVSEIMTAIVSGTKIAYEKQGLPFFEIIFEEVGESEIGSFLQFKMIEMMYLGKLMEVNTFDQPEVELYKIETKKILNGVKRETCNVQREV